MGVNFEPNACLYDLLASHEYGSSFKRDLRFIVNFANRRM